jgi:hypothetical protein
MSDLRDAFRALSVRQAPREATEPTVGTQAWVIVRTLRDATLMLQAHGRDLDPPDLQRIAEEAANLETVLKRALAAQRKDVKR